MGFVPAHWECDHCGKTTSRDELRAVPANAVCLSSALCRDCRTKLGWTDEAPERWHEQTQKALSRSLQRIALQMAAAGPDRPGGKS